jgi:hypothetical protein
VSLHDGDARPIAKGQLGKPVQFGYKAQVVDNDDGVVLDHTLHQGNPAEHTTWSRSVHWPASQSQGTDQPVEDRRPNTRQSTATQFFRSKYLQHRGRPDPRGRLGRRRLRTSLLEGVSHQAAETNPHNSGRSRNRSNGEAFATRSTRRHQLRERGATHGHQFLQRAGQNRPPRWCLGPRIGRDSEAHL